MPGELEPHGPYICPECEFRTRSHVDYFAHRMDAHESPTLRRARRTWMIALGYAWGIGAMQWLFHFARGRELHFWCFVPSFVTGAVVGMSFCILDRWRHRNDP